MRWEAPGGLSEACSVWTPGAACLWGPTLGLT